MRYFCSQNNFKNKNLLGKKRFLKLFKKSKKKTFTQKETAVEFKNPYKKERRDYRKLAALITLPLVIIIWILFLIYNSFFQIKELEFVGLKIIKKEEVENKIKDEFLKNTFLFPKSNYFLISSSKIKKFLNNNYTLEEVFVEKKFPNKIFINIKEKVSTIVYDNEKEYFLLGQDGIILKKIDMVQEDEFFLIPLDENPLILIEKETENTNTTSTPNINNTEMKRIHRPNYEKISLDFTDYPILYDKRKLDVEIEQKILDEKSIKNLINFYSELIKQGIGIKYLEMEHPLAGVKIITKQNFYILFQPKNDIYNQLEKINTILKENTVINEYVDLRYEDRVYWK